MASPITVEPEICLASVSPRRAQLLEQIGVRFTTVDPAVDEPSIVADEPRERVRRVARAKADAGAAAGIALPVLAADTAVVLDDLELGKPVDRDHAARMLAMLSGRSHWVYTAVVVHAGDSTFEALGATEVWFNHMSSRDIDAYCASGEPFDKAGAYGIQGRAAVFVSRIEGSYSNVVGLPLYETAGLLREAGIWR